MRDTTDYDRVVRPEELSVLKVLQGAALESVWGVIEHCPVLALRPEEVLMGPEHAARTMYLVVSGSLRVEQSGSGGPAKAVAVGPGESLGEVCMLEGGHEPGRVRAVEQSRVIALDEDAFWRLVGASHAFAANVLATVAGRLQKRVAGSTGGAELRPALELGVSVDGLTGLPGKEWLGQMLPRIVNRYSRDRRPLSVLLIDIDHLKRVNESFGQQGGDLVLTSLGRILRWCLRPTDISARIAGEEFCVILPGASRDGAKAAAERLRQTVLKSQVTSEEGAPYPPVALSIGVAQLGSDGDAKAMLKAGAAALKGAKDGGGNQVVAA